MAPPAATPLSWTLRFKNHKSTILLHVEPLQSLNSVKAELLHALQHTHPDGRLPSGTPIPSNPADILLAKAKDFHDLTRGWERISSSNQDGLDEEAEGKAKKRRTNAEDCPKGVGLRDGAALAYKFKDEVVGDTDEGLGLEDDEDEQWDVVVPTYDEATEGGLPQLPPYSE